MGPRENMLKTSLTASGLLKVDFELQKKQYIVIDVCDTRGKKVFSSGSQELEAGKHSKCFGDKAAGMAAGIYVIRLSGSVGSMVQKFVKIR